MHLLIVIYMACKILAKWWSFLNWYLPLRFGRDRSIPALKFVGGAFPLELQFFFKWHLFERSDSDTLTNIAAILNVHVNMPCISDCCVFLDAA